MAKRKQTGQKLPRNYPGEILPGRLMKPLGLSAHRLSMDLPCSRTSDCRDCPTGRRAITADTAVRLGGYFKMTPRFWLNLQTPTTWN